MPDTAPMGNAWKALVARVVLFPIAPGADQLPAAYALFHQVWGSDPESFQKAPNPLAPAIAQGKHGRMNVNCIVQPTRIDFTFSPEPPPEASLGLELIHDSAELAAGLRTVIAGIRTNLILPISRVAINAQFVSQAPNHAQANQVLTATMPPEYRPQLSGEVDFILQVNRPYPSHEVNGTTMNSIIKWSVERLQVMTFSLPVSGPVIEAHGSAAQTSELVIGSVMLDNNNVPSNVPLSVEQQSALLDEEFETMRRIQRDIGLNLKGF